MTYSKDNKAFEIRSRLNGIREYLELNSPINSPEFEQAVIEACRKKVDVLLTGIQSRSGEEILSYLADQLQVRFEEVHDDADIANLEKKYLKEKGEIGFGQLEMELNSPGVDALLFQRMRAPNFAHDRWVAVLNLRESRSRGYWNRAHELTHRIVEPPQYRLPFYRHRDDSTNPLELLIDKSAVELAFYPELFLPIIESVNSNLLSWDLVDLVRDRYASSASRHATANAVLHHWPCPAYLLMARLAGRKGRPDIDRELRVEVQRFSPTALGSVFFFPNMRVPISSPIWHCFQTSEAISDYEQLGRWVTSCGNSLPNMRAFTSAFCWRDRVCSLISLV